jgi:hypothetical protein
MSKLAVPDTSPSDRLRRALAAQRLSPLEAARLGQADTGDIARLTATFGGSTPVRNTTRRRGNSVVSRARGCEVCRGAAVTEGLCSACRERMVLPLVDSEAAKEAALAYRLERAARQAAEREMERRRKAQGTSGAPKDSTPEDDPRYRLERSAEGWLLLRRNDGAGYIVRPSGPGFVMTEWVNSADVLNGKKRRFLVEDFLREVPEVRTSPGCEDAVRTLGSCSI